jgi:cytochrome b involved in lipid metabolism
MSVAEKEYSEDEIKRLVDGGRTVVVLFGAVYDLSSYLDIHPGGRKILI